MAASIPKWWRRLSGEVATTERVDEKNKLVLSVAVPVQRFKAIYGVLMVSTESGDIDDILREERATLMEVFLVGFDRDAGVLALSGRFHRRADPQAGRRRRPRAPRPGGARNHPADGRAQ